MARAKDYKAKTPAITIDLAADSDASGAIVALPPNPRNHNIIDLRPWLGHGFDDWVWAAATVLKARLHSGNYSVASIVSFAANGMKVFLPYLTGNQGGIVPSRPSDMTATDVVRYIAWLRLFIMFLPLTNNQLKQISHSNYSCHSAILINCDCKIVSRLFHI